MKMQVPVIALLIFSVFTSGIANAQNGVEPSSTWYPKVAPILQHSCSQCHIAKENGKKGMAARKFDLTDFLATKKITLSDVELAQLEKVIQKGSMPPKPYTWLHPETKVSEGDKAVILNWIKAEKTSKDDN